MESLSGYIKKFARIIIGQEYEIEEIKIFFSAPDPHRPSGETLTIEKEKPGEANFQWQFYQALIREGKNYYIYSLPLHPNGSAKLPDKVFESDSDWSSKKKDMPSKDVSPGDIKRTFPKLLKAPDLHPPEEFQTKYVNTDKSDKGESYSSQEFKRLFDNDFYVVLNPKSKELKNPFDDPIGMKYPKEEEKEEPEK